MAWGRAGAAPIRRLCPEVAQGRAELRHFGGCARKWRGDALGLRRFGGCARKWRRAALELRHFGGCARKWRRAARPGSAAGGQDRAVTLLSDGGPERCNPDRMAPELR